MRCLNGLALLMVSSALMAQQPAPTVSWAQVQGGLSIQHNAPCLDNGLGAGLGIGHWVSPRWGWEAGVLDTLLQDKAQSWSARETHLDASGLYGLTASPDSWHPFLRAGAGASKLENPLSLAAPSTIRLNLVAGLGIQYFSKDGAMASLEVRGTTIRSSEPRTEGQVLLGVGGHW
jgi:hypothetical protein